MLLRMAAIAAVVLVLAAAAVAPPDRAAAGQPPHPSRRAAGRQFLDVRSLGRYRAPSNEARNCPPHRRRRRPAQLTAELHAAAFWPRSRAGRASQPDMLEETVGSDFGSRLATVLEPLAAFAIGRRPRPAHWRPPSIWSGPTDGDNLVLYLISDFRAREWNEPGELVKSLPAAQRARIPAGIGQLRRDGPCQPGHHVAAADARRPRRPACL